MIKYKTDYTKALQDFNCNYNLQYKIPWLIFSFY